MSEESPARNEWEVVQKKTFTKWVNTKLKARGLNVEDVTAEFTTGVPLIHLLEVIGNESLGKFNKQPKMRIQKVENLNRCLEFIKVRGVPLTNIGAEDILDGNEKLVLGLLWIIILRFTISEISEGELSAKEGLLLWCQKKTQGYKDVHVKDFTFSWVDGLALCALIHRHRPDLIKFDELEAKNKKHNVNLAFEVAEKHLGIPRLLDVEDLTDLAKPDERSVMTYIAQYFHAFSTAGKFETACRRLAKFTNVVEHVWELQNDYEKRVKKFLDDVKLITESWKQTKFDGTYVQAKEFSNEFQKFKITQKRDLVAEKRDLDTLLSNINTKLRTYNLKPYLPAQGLELEVVEQTFKYLLEQESNQRKQINTQIREIKESLRTKFAQLANQFHEHVNGISLALGSLEGELEQQLQQVVTLESKLSQVEAQVPVLNEANDKCNEANIEENDYTVFSVDDLVFDLGLVKQSLAKKTAFIQNQITARSVTNLTPQQLEEFESAFRHFDRDNSNTLSKLEFKACLNSLDVLVDDVEQVFERLVNSKEEDAMLSFADFVKFMVSIVEDSTSISQLRECFSTIASNKQCVTEEDLRKAQLDDLSVKFLTKLGFGNDGFDYNAFLDKVCQQ